MILAEVLGGVELGAWDRRVAGWLAGLDTATALTIASWIERSRARGAQSCAAAARRAWVMPYMVVRLRHGWRPGSCGRVRRAGQCCR